MPGVGKSYKANLQYKNNLSNATFNTKQLDLQQWDKR